MITGTTLLTAASLISAIFTLALSFDDQRRHDPAFRRKIRNRYRRAARAAAKVRRAQSAETTKALRVILDTIGKETENMPDTSVPYVREAYFLEQTNQGEHFMRLSGLDNEMYAAAHFVRAIRTCNQDEIPNILYIYKVTQRPSINGYVQEMLSLVKEEKWFLLGPLTDPVHESNVE